MARKKEDGSTAAGQPGSLEVHIRDDAGVVRHRARHPVEDVDAAIEHVKQLQPAEEADELADLPEDSESGN